MTMTSDIDVQSQTGLTRYFSMRQICKSKAALLTQRNATRQLGDRAGPQGGD